MRNGHFGRVFFGLSVAAAALCAVPAAAQQETQRYDLSEQSLGSALRAISIQSGQSVVAPAALVAGKRSRALTGTYSTEDAVARLLDGSGLRAVRVGNALVIQRQFAESAQDAQGDGEGAGSEAILVTGTRIRGRRPAGSSVITIDRSAIDQSGYATTQQILQALPQNFGGGPNEATIETNRGNASLNGNYGSGINLRGLGSGSTLVLLDGERPPMAGFAGIFTDLSMIPTAAIERIEILADGASALYGSDAVAGVVNIVPRKRFTGLETRGRFGLGDGFDEVQASVIAGKDWSSGHVMIAYDYYDRGRLAAADRPYVSEDLRSFGAGDYRGNFSNPGTIVAGSQNFAIPRGQNGSGLSPALLVAGTVNLQDQWMSADILPQQRRHAVFAAAEQELAPDVELYAQALFGDRNFDRRRPASLNNALRTVPVTNPFYVDPIGTHQPIRVRYSFLRDLGPEGSRGSSSAVGVTGGLRFTPGAWAIDAHLTFGQQVDNSVYYNRVNTARLAVALADTNPATAYNLLGDGANTNPATINSVRGSTTSHGRYWLWSGQVRSDGPLFTLPGGSARLALGGEFRAERYRDGPTIGDTSTLTPQPLAAIPTPGTRRITAGYAEVSLPLASPELGLPLLRRLDVSAAVRTEDYSDFGRTTNPKFGLSWQPAGGVTVRGSWGTSFRAPSFNDLRPDLATQLQFAIELVDPASATGTSFAMILRGTIPDLGPETATSWTAGIDLEPSFFKGFRAQLTYFNIDYRNRIASPASEVLNFLINRSTYAPIINTAPAPGQIAALFASPNYLPFFSIDPSKVTMIIDARTQNLAVQSIDGLDFDVRYAAPVAGGTFEIGASGSYLLGYSQALTPSAPAIDLRNTLGNPVDFRLRGRLSYAGPAFGGAVFVNYVDGYTNRQTVTPRKVGSWTTVDAQLSYRFGEEHGPLAGVSLALNASNLFDTDPPFTINNLGTSVIGYDPENANAIGRVFSFQVSRKW